MTPSSGYTGTSVTLSITDSSYQLQGRYKVLWNSTTSFDQNGSLVLQEGTIPTSATSFNANIIIPESAFGNHYIRFQLENSGVFSTFQFTVKARLTINVPAGKPGDLILISGNGFPANDLILIKIDNTILNASILTGTKGAFTHQLQMPQLPPGEYKLSAVSESYSVYESAAITIVPPPTKEPPPPENKPPDTNIVPTEPIGDYISPQPPTPISPIRSKIGVIGSQEVLFQWSAVTDKSGVRYTLEVGDSIDSFAAKPLIQVSNLSDSSYSAYLEPGRYYWRVKAIDGAGNQSNWYFAPYGFHVGELSIVVNDLISEIQSNETLLLILISAGFLFALWIVYSIIQSFIRSTFKKHND